MVTDVPYTNPTVIDTDQTTPGGMRPTLVITELCLNKTFISHSRSITGNGLQSHWKLQKLRLLKTEKTEAQLFSHTGETFCRKKKRKDLVDSVLRNCTEATHGECKTKIFQCNTRNKFLKVSAIQEHQIARCPASFEQPPLTILYLP